MTVSLITADLYFFAVQLVALSTNDIVKNSQHYMKDTEDS